MAEGTSVPTLNPGEHIQDWKWKVYLQVASKVVIITDHHPFQWLRQHEDPAINMPGGSWSLSQNTMKYSFARVGGVGNLLSLRAKLSLSVHYAGQVISIL